MDTTQYNRVGGNAVYKLAGFCQTIAMFFFNTCFFQVVIIKASVPKIYFRSLSR